MIEIFNCPPPYVPGDIVIRQLNALGQNTITLYDDDIARIIGARYNVDAFIKDDLVKAIRVHSVLSSIIEVLGEVAQEPYSDSDLASYLTTLQVRAKDTLKLIEDK